MLSAASLAERAPTSCKHSRSESALSVVVPCYVAWSRIGLVVTGNNHCAGYGPIHLSLSCLLSTGGGGGAHEPEPVLVRQRGRHCAPV